MKTLIVVGLLMTGCGPDVPTPFTYHSKCVNVRSSMTLSQARLDAHLRTAAAIYDSYYGEDAWCELMVSTNTDITVVGHNFTCYDASGRTCDGWYDLVGGIEINGYHCPLLHETFHVLEVKNGILDSARHYHWKEKGYLDVSAQLCESEHRSILQPERPFSN